VAGAFLIYELIVGDWMELICKLYSLFFHGVSWFVDLTSVFTIVFGERIFFILFRLLRDTEEGSSVVPAAPPLRPSADRKRLFEARCLRHG
jgi:hypothetical protein